MAEILFDLKKELEDNQALDSHERQTMEALAEEIEIKLDDPQADLNGDQYLLTKLKEAAEEFEANHPKFTNIVGRVSTLLSNMGI
nr:DUF4404 family protein [Aliikangiella sp. G2MR2-5]